MPTPRLSRQRQAAIAGSDAARGGKAAGGDRAPPVSDGERKVLLELRQRRQELDARDAALATRESVLAAAEQKLASRVGELQALQKKLEALEAHASNARTRAGRAWSSSTR